MPSINRGITALRSRWRTANSKDEVKTPDFTPYLIDHFCKIIPRKSNSPIKGAKTIDNVLYTKISGILVKGFLLI